MFVKVPVDVKVCVCVIVGEFVKVFVGMIEVGVIVKVGVLVAVEVKVFVETNTVVVEVFVKVAVGVFRAGGKGEEGTLNFWEHPATKKINPKTKRAVP